MADFGAGLGSLLGGLFNDYEAPFEEAGKAARPWFDRAANEFEPYSQFGQRGMGRFEDWLSGMKDPTSFINNLMGKYQESPWSRFSKDQAMRASTNAASASGTIGSTPFANEVAQNAAGISSQDMQNWLAQVLGINSQYGQGWQNAINTGTNANAGRANIFSNRGNMEGYLAGGKAGARNNRWNDIFGGLGNIAGGAADAYFGGGF